MEELLNLIKDMNVAQIEGDRGLLTLINTLIERVMELETVVAAQTKSLTIHSIILKELLDTKETVN
jgi:hypothetical protein